MVLPQLSQNIPVSAPGASFTKTDYRQTSIIRRTLVGNKLVDNSDVVEASPAGAAPTYSFILDLTPGFNGLCRDNCKTRWESFKFCELVHLILEI